MDPSSIASLKVTNAEVKENNKRYTVYKVFVNSNGKSWFILRRYNEFHNLYEEIKDLYPNVPKFPGKRLFGNLDPKFVERRRVGLDLFVRHLLSHTRIIEHKSVREFFGLSYVQHGSATSSDSSDADSEINKDDKNDSDSDSESQDDQFKLGPSERKHARPSDFDYLKVVGKGSFGKVYLARHKKERREYAVKVLSKVHIKRRNEVRHIMSERNVLLTNVKHPFLVGLHYSFQTKDKLYFVLDYLNGGELFFHLQREKTFSECRSRFYTAEIGSALGYLHEKKIIYRDLKPENLLLDRQGHVVLTDFGLCKEGVTGKQTTSTFCGTPEYLAPEVLLKQPYDRTVDWWCLGSVMYEMLFGLPPFYSRDHKEMYDRILHQSLRIKNIVSEAARDILTGMLHKDRFRRLGARHDFKELRDHQFFADINWEDLEARKIGPPFNPQVRGVMDFRNIDSEFTREAVPDSVGKSLVVSVQGADNDFAGFTYVPKTLEDIGEDEL